MIPLNDISNALPVVWQWIIGICGGITAIAAAVAVIRKPWNTLIARIDALEKKHDTDQESNEKRLQADLDLLHEMNATIKHLNYGVFVLLDHAATGNSVDRCRKARDELEKHSSGIE